MLQPFEAQTVLISILELERVRNIQGMQFKFDFSDYVCKVLLVTGAFSRPATLQISRCVFSFFGAQATFDRSVFVGRFVVSDCCVFAGGSSILTKSRWWTAGPQLVVEPVVLARRL